MAKASTPLRPVVPVISRSSSMGMCLPWKARTIARQTAPQSATSIWRMTGTRRLIGPPLSPEHRAEAPGEHLEDGLRAEHDDGAAPHLGGGPHGRRLGLVESPGQQNGGLLRWWQSRS